MIKDDGLIVGLVLMALACVTAARGEDRPDLSKPEVLQKILGEAILRDTLEERGPEGEKLFYTPDSQTPYTGWAKRMHDNGKVGAIGYSKEGKQEGPYTVWHENGKKAEKGTYKDGKREGPGSVWHDNGQMAQQATYKDGEREGLCTQWHDNGQKWEVATYEDGEPQGVITYWHESGWQAGVTTFKDGRQEGLYTKWHDNGQKEEQGTYKDGELEGLVTTWDESGAVILQAHFKNGKRFIEGESDLDDPKTLEEIVGKAVGWDTLKQVGLLYHVAGNPEPYTGWIKKFHDNGKMAALGMLKNGKPDGLWTLWFDDGRKEEEILY